MPDLIHQKYTKKITEKCTILCDDYTYNVYEKIYNMLRLPIYDGQ